VLLVVHPTDSEFNSTATRAVINRTELYDIHRTTDYQLSQTIALHALQPILARGRKAPPINRDKYVEEKCESREGLFLQIALSRKKYLEEICGLSRGGCIGMDTILPNIAHLDNPWTESNQRELGP